MDRGGVRGAGHPHGPVDPAVAGGGVARGRGRLPPAGARPGRPTTRRARPRVGPAAVWLAVAIVYLAQAPAAFGKRRDGTLAWWAWLLWAPIFGYMRLLHELARSLTRESVADQVAPGVWVGRRPRRHELPDGIA